MIYLLAALTVLGILAAIVIAGWALFALVVGVAVIYRARRDGSVTVTYGRDR